MEKEFFISYHERDLVLDLLSRYSNLSIYSRPDRETWIKSITRTPVYILPITAEEYEIAVGSPPENDDLERVNCSNTTSVGHRSCGWNVRKQLPNFMG